jgi:cell division protein FtsB
MAQQSIERLRKEYPSSSWTGMAAPLAELLTATTELRRQNRTLKNQNQSLSRENQSLSKEAQELRQNIEKLKRLDLELEQRNK